MSIFTSIGKLFRREEEDSLSSWYSLEAKRIARDSKRKGPKVSMQHALSTFRSSQESVWNKIRAREQLFLRTFSREERLVSTGFMTWSLYLCHDYSQDEFDIWVKLVEKEITEEEAIEMMTEIMELHYGKKFSPDWEIDTVEDSDSNLGATSSHMDGPRVDTIENSHGRFGYSESNPIPVAHISGEVDYLSRLRCSCNQPFDFHRVGSVGSGPDGHIVDEYELICKTGKHKVVLYMDMYRSGQSNLIPDGLTKAAPEATFMPSDLAAEESQLDGMNLRQLLRRDFDIDFPISGGTGNSRDNPIVIHRQKANDYTSVEQGILRCIGIGRGVELEFIENNIFKHNGRILDQVKIEEKETTETNVITGIMNYYFDITECFNTTPGSDDETDHDYPSSDEIPAYQNSKLIDNETGLYSVIDLVTIRLPGPWFWQFEDVNEKARKGSFFVAYDKEEECDIGALVVVDVTGDETELDVSKLEDVKMPELDRFLEEFNTKLEAHGGKEIIQWMPSQLSQSENANRLVNEYVVRDPHRDKDFYKIELRFKAKDRPIVAIGYVDVAQGEMLVSQITNSIREVAVIDSKND